MSSLSVKIVELLAPRPPSINPARCSDETFELYSIPAFDRGNPDIVAGREIGSAKQVVAPGDVLLSKIVPHIRRAWVVGKSSGRRILASSEWIVLRSEHVDPHYLRFVLSSDKFHQQFMTTVGGVGGSLLRAQRDQVAQIEVPLRTPDEQRSIADVLDAVLRGVQLESNAIYRAAALKRAAMQQLFTRGLRSEPQGETEIGPLPASWDIQRLGALGRIGNGSTPKKSVTEFWSGGTYPWLTSAKVYDREITSADRFVTDEALTKCHLPRLRPRTVLMAITGEGKTLGHCAVLQIEATISQHLAYISTDPELADPSFVRSYLETQYEYLRQIAAGGGSTKGALTCAFLRDLKLPLPSLAEQREIVAVLDSIDYKIDRQKRKRTLLKQLFETLLNGLMTGEISVADLDLASLGENDGSGVSFGSARDTKDVTRNGAVSATSVGSLDE